MTLTHNRFLHDTLTDHRREEVQQILVGVLLAPSMLFGSTGMVGRAGGSLIPTLLERGRIVANEFHGLSVGVFAMASLGEIRIEHNVVRDCHGGVWLFAMGMQSIAATAGEFEVMSSVDRGIVDGLDSELKALFSDDLLAMIALFGRVYPLPAESAGFTHDRLRPIEIGERVKKAERFADTQRFVTDAAAPFSLSGDRGSQPLAAERSAATAAGSPAFVEAAAGLNLKLVDADRSLARAAPTADLRLRVCGNDLDCRADRDRETGSALLVFAVFPREGGSALVSDNRMTGRPPNAVAALAMIPNAAVNANLVRNESGKSRSLALLGCRQVAVTGNIVLGPTLVPPRPFAPPLDTWASLNTGM